ncbi:MAG: phytoene synthase [Flavobacterium sp. BFFFF1]|uniref:phytoene/squalene synthase family protein n=1 Tax=unclassified Flavobacterium TaxID=196869 RepID=UPI000BC7B6F2|nr:MULTISPECIES: phytoene/squalene synthase family protein [unclassified Flavobacterium]OYU80561.1 MAG: phytoene synthase [Flavobacterium sp. BFFFF1]
MKSIFDTISFNCSRDVTKAYSTSFSSAVRMLAPSIRQDIYNIYGFVRFADEIVDSFHDFNKSELLDRFETDLKASIKDKISLNPILNAFQHTVHKYSIPSQLIDSFMKSMRLDLFKTTYETKEDYEQYIYGSADVVGLMCLKVFVNGDAQKYNALEHSAMKLGSAFQKVNFLRDLKTDHEILNRTYFPDTDLNNLNEDAKQKIISEIEADFKVGYEGISALPLEAKFGVYTAYVYYRSLLSKLKKIPSTEIKNKRIRVPDYQKYGLFAKCYLTYRLNFI